MRWLYAAFNLGIAAGPFVASTVWLRSFWRQWRALLWSFALVSLPWIVLDIAAHASGWWAYNTQFISGIRLFELPIEEIAFFFVVPFACLVLWHGLQAKVHGNVPVAVPRIVLGLIIAGCLIVGTLYMPHIRTLIDAGLAVLTAVCLLGTTLVRRRVWWVWNTVVLVLFLLCNTFLTAVPIVTYNDSFMTGWRIGTIPFEDFIYNFSLLNLALLVFDSHRQRPEGRAAALFKQR